MNINLFNLEGKTAVVTGCNTGLGQAIAIGLAQAGCNILGVNRSAPFETQQKIVALGRQFVNVEADLSNIDCIPDIVEQAISEFKHIDILVNNAGIIRREDAFNFSEQDWDDVMNVNLKSVFFLSQAIAKQFIAQNSGGKIINIAL